MMATNGSQRMLAWTLAGVVTLGGCAAVITNQRPSFATPLAARCHLQWELDWSAHLLLGIREMSDKQNEMKEKKSVEVTVGIWLVMGMSFGAAFGAAFGNAGVGVALGTVAGIVIGTALSRRSKDNDGRDDA